GLKQAEEVRTGRHRRVVLMDGMARLASNRIEQLPAQRHGIDQRFFVRFSAALRRWRHLRKVRRLVDGVANFERTLLHLEKCGAAMILVVPVRARRGALEDHVALDALAVANFEREGVLEFVETLVEPRAAEPERKGLPLAVALENEHVAPLHVERRLRARRALELQAREAIGGDAARRQHALWRGILKAERAIGGGPCGIGTE